MTDQSGCAIDKVIMSDLQYNNQVCFRVLFTNNSQLPQANMAFVEAHVFKFADKVTTYFQCAVSLCMKEENACAGVTVSTRV